MNLESLPLLLITQILIRISIQYNNQLVLSEWISLKNTLLQEYSKQTSGSLEVRNAIRKFLPSITIWFHLLLQSLFCYAYAIGVTHSLTSIKKYRSYFQIFSKRYTWQLGSSACFLQFITRFQPNEGSLYSIHAISLWPYYSYCSILKTTAVNLYENFILLGVDGFLVLLLLSYFHIWKISLLVNLYCIMLSISLFCLLDHQYSIGAMELLDLLFVIKCALLVLS